MRNVYWQFNFAMEYPNNRKKDNVTRKEYLSHHCQEQKENGGDEYVGTHKMLKFLNNKSNDIKNWALKHQYHCISDTADQYARKLGGLLVKEKNTKKFGFWYGNDTIGRTILDIIHIVFYCGKDGKMKKDKQRTVFPEGWKEVL